MFYDQIGCAVSTHLPQTPGRVEQSYRFPPAQEQSRLGNRIAAAFPTSRSQDLKRLVFASGIVSTQSWVEGRVSGSSWITMCNQWWTRKRPKAILKMLASRMQLITVLATLSLVRSLYLLGRCFLLSKDDFSSISYGFVSLTIRPMSLNCIEVFLYNK